MSKGFTGNINVSGSFLIAHGTWQQNEEAQKMHRRSILPGYPIELPFKYMEEISKYLEGDKITCLLCGKQYKSLNPHLKVHNYDVKRYQEKYGIPYKYGLCGTATSKKLTANAFNMIEAGKWPLEKMKREEMWKKSIIVRAKNNIPRTEAHKNLLRNNIKIARQIRCKNALQRTTCNKCDNQLGNNRRCRTCDRAYSRQSKGHLPREVAAKTLSEKNCFHCGAIVYISRLGHANTGNFRCKECFKKYLKEYDSKRDKDARRKQAHENYMRRKEREKNIRC